MDKVVNNKKYCIDDIKNYDLSSIENLLVEKGILTRADIEKELDILFYNNLNLKNNP